MCEVAGFLSLAPPFFHKGQANRIVAKMIDTKLAVRQQGVVLKAETSFKSTKWAVPAMEPADVQADLDRQVRKESWSCYSNITNEY